jgi:hypothetical protein
VALKGSGAGREGKQQKGCYENSKDLTYKSLRFHHFPAPGFKADCKMGTEHFSVLYHDATV